MIEAVAFTALDREVPRRALSKQDPAYQEKIMIRAGVVGFG